jgi:hypothetical protein
VESGWKGFRNSPFCLANDIDYLQLNWLPIRALVALLNSPTKMTDKRYFFIVIALIVFCGLMSYRQFEELGESPKEINLPKLEKPEFNLESLLEEEKELKEFISPDGKLSLKYSANWVGSDQILAKNIKQGVITVKEAELLFLASRFDFEKQAGAFLAIEKTDAKKTLEEIIEEIKQEATFVDSKKENGAAVLEAKYKNEDAPEFYLKGRVILGENETYLITISTPERDWPIFKEEADQIFNSVQYTP